MPYIKREDYIRAACLPISAGELNYAITLKIIEHLETGSSRHNTCGTILRLCKAYINRRGLTYTIGNEVIGVLVCAGLEAVRRCGDTGAVSRVPKMLADVGNYIYDDVLAPYEDARIRENGDVYSKTPVV